MKARVTRYPNNEVRVAVFPEKFPADYLQLGNFPVLQEPENKPAEENYTTVKGSDSILSSEIDALDIKSKVDTAPRKPRVALSRRGRLTIHRAGSCFDMSEGTERLLLTGTLPGSLPEAFKALAEFSTTATKTLTNWLTRRHPGCKWIYAWEYQKRGALHLHLVAELPTIAAKYVKQHFKDEWNRIITKITALSGVNLRKKTQQYIHTNEVTQADVTVCDKEPSRYISKYVTKQSTQGFGRWRYPPKQWYQISRSLLSALREKTEIYEVEGLGYGKALAFIEQACHNLVSHSCSGWRYFEGAVLAWSGYGYADTFEITEWGKNLQAQKNTMMAVQTIAKYAIQTSKGYPQTRCWMRHVDVAKIETAMLTQTVSEAEMLMLTEAVTQSLMASWSSMRNRLGAAKFLQCYWNWCERKKFTLTVTESFREEVNKICNE